MAIRNPKPFREKQAIYRKIVFENTPESAFGLEWLIRVILIYIPWWLFIGNWIKALTDDYHIFVRRSLIDSYVVLKVILSWWLVSNHYAELWYVVTILAWFAIETVYALLSGIFLRDIWSEPFSYQRNLTLMLFNYVEICLCFAAIYTFKEHCNNGLNPSLFVISNSLASTDKHLTSFQSIYFSFITAATIGYGDISPKSEDIQTIVMLQTMVSLVFIVMFIASASGKLGTGTLSGSVKEVEPRKKSEAT